MSFLSVAVGVRTNGNILLNLLKIQSPTDRLLKNRFTLKISTSTRSMGSDSKCIFCQIVNKTADANILHEVNYTDWYKTLFPFCVLGREVVGIYWPKSCLWSALSCDTQGWFYRRIIYLGKSNPSHDQEHIVDIRALRREDIPLVKEMEEVGLKVLQDRTGQTDNVLTGFHWPIHTVGHLHLHIIAPADKMRFLSRIIFSGMFFGSSQAAIQMLEKK